MATATFLAAAVPHHLLSLSCTSRANEDLPAVPHQLLLSQACRFRVPRDRAGRYVHRQLCVRADAPAAEVRARTRVHKLIDENGAVLVPGCYDALSATVVQKAGFSASFLSGYALSATLLGRPDFGFLMPPEMAMAARFICSAASKIPIIVDADTGGGNALNARRTVEDLISAGAAGCVLEDQVWPKRCGHMRGKQVIPVEEHASKIAAARDAIGNADFFLVARTDVRGILAKNGLEEAISRANLYIEAGADATFVEAPRDDDELKEIGKQTVGYRVCNMVEGGLTPLHNVEELQEMGFHIILYPLTTLYSTTRAMMDRIKSLKEKGTSRDDLDKVITFQEFNELMNLESWYALEAHHSPNKRFS
eukprot:c11016_g1_i1 orf=85-1179(+)